VKMGIVIQGYWYSSSADAENAISVSRPLYVIRL